MHNVLMPMIIEQTEHGERGYDLYSRLLKDRIIYLGEPITDQVANSINLQLLFLQTDDSSAPISLYINSPGGSVSAGLAIYDTMQFVYPEVRTICVGMAASMGALLLTAGAAGQRRALPNSRIMIHQPSGGAQGQASDIEITAKEILRYRKVLNQIMADHTGQSVKRIEQDTDRDNYFSSEEAVKYGLIDSVLKRETGTDETNTA